MEGDHIEKMLSRNAATRRFQLYGLAAALALGIGACGPSSCAPSCSYPTRVEKKEANLFDVLEALGRGDATQIDAADLQKYDGLERLVKDFRTNGIDTEKAFWMYLAKGDSPLNAFYLLGDEELRDKVRDAMIQAGSAQLETPMRVEDVRGVFAYMAANKPDIKKPLEIKYWIAGQKGANLYRAYLLKEAFGDDFDTTQRVAFSAPEDLSDHLRATNAAFQREYDRRIRRGFYHTAEELAKFGHEREYSFLANF